MSVVEVHNYETGAKIPIELSKLDARKTHNLDFKEFTGRDTYKTPQNALHVSTGALETTGLDTCVGIAIRDVASGKCILAHIDALTNHWDLTELLRKRVSPETAKVDLFNYRPPYGNEEDYLFHRARTVAAASLQKLGLLEKAQTHNVSLYDKVKVSPDGISINANVEKSPAVQAQATTLTRLTREELMAKFGVGSRPGRSVTES